MAAGADAGAEAGGGPADRFRILCVDGGGIKGLVSALVIAEIESRLKARGRPARMADCFHLFAGTSTGGLIALALTRPDPVRGEQLAGFYTEDGSKSSTGACCESSAPAGGCWGRNTTTGRCARPCWRG